MFTKAPENTGKTFPLWLLFNLLYLLITAVG